MARGFLNRRNAQDVLDEHKKEIESVLSELKGKDPDMYKVFVDAGDLARISGLEDFYRIVPSAMPERNANGRMNRELESEREDIRKLGSAGEITNTMNVNGIDYVVEDYLRNPSLVDSNTPAEVLRKKQELYPEGINLVKIPQAKNRTEATLLSLAMNELEGRWEGEKAGTPVAPAMDLSYESRKMSDGLRQSLLNQELLDKRSPLEALKYAGQRSYRSRAAEPGNAFEEIQSVMIGDMVRRVNPVNNTPYGPAFMEDGVLVRDQAEGGHVKEHAQYGDLSNKASNIIVEPRAENRVKAPRGQGVDFTDRQALFNNINTAIAEGNDLSNLKHNLMAVAAERPELRGRVINLLKQIETVQQMPAQGRGGRQAEMGRGWVNL